VQITVVQPPELEPGDLQADKLQKTIEALSTEASTADIPWKRGIALEKLGSVYFFTRQLEQAIKTLISALEAYGDENSPMVTRVYITLGLAFRSIGRAKEALATWDKGIGLLVDRSIKLINEEESLPEQEAEVDHHTLLADSRIGPRIRRLCQTDLNFSILRNNMGVVYYEQGDHRMARKMFEQSIDFIPSTVHYDHPVGNLDSIL
jgi:tetratricopeptide (TPR) repeat protein